MTSIVVHYNELALKGKNRPWFVHMLVRNIRTALTGLGVPVVRSVMGRIEIQLGPNSQWSDVKERLRTVFGIAYFSQASRAPLDLDEMAAAILRDLDDQHPASFRVSARRTDKRYPLTSPQIEYEVGGRIKEAKGWRVDLKHPELTIHLDLMPDHAFYFLGKEAGAGGLPTGTGGRVACLLSGGFDSPVAAFRLMRRGCSVLLIHFHSYPILSRASQEKVRELAGVLTTYQQRSRLVLVPFGDIQQKILLTVQPELRVVMYPAADDAHHREDRAALAREGAGQRRSDRTGGLADARQPDDDRRGHEDAGAAAARRHGQGRNYRAGAAHRDL